MSLVPYLIGGNTPESDSSSREVILRHNDAVVIYDPLSKQLVLRDASHPNTLEITKCPTCHRSLRDDDPGCDRGRRGSPPDINIESNYVSPEYFRMLAHSLHGSAESSAPPSPRRRLAQPILPGSDTPSRAPANAEFVTSSPVSPPPPQGISSAAFSPNYFKRFFVEEKELGRGGKGVVLLVKHMLDGVSLGQFACKRVPVGDDHEWLEKVLIEVQLLQHLSHQNLVSYRHVWLEDFKLTNFGPSVPCAFMLQQYCNGGDLHNYICNTAKSTTTTQQLKEQMRRRSKGQPELPKDLHGPRRLHFDEIYSFFKGITSGLNHLHANGYVHRDLKPSNCLLHDTGKGVKILVSDFGEVQLENMRERPGGAFGNFTTKSDIFSLGMILYFMCFGRLPYINADNINEEDEDVDQLRSEISAWSGFNEAESRVRSDLPEQLYKFLKRLLSLDPTNRPSTEEILQGIKAGSGIDEPSNFQASSSNIFEDIRSSSRISRVDSPVPDLNLREPQRKMSAPTGFTATRPIPTNFRPSSFSRDRQTSFTTAASSEAQRGSSPSSPLESSLVLRHPTEKSYFDSTDDGEEEPPHTPLIMPPPQSMTSRSYDLLTSKTMVMTTKIALFLLKMVSITQPCSPLATNSWIAYPLLCVAALDFGFIPYGDKKGSGIVTIGSLAVHGLVVSVAARWGALCVSKATVIWEGL
ncbi:MAG: putative serine/threonine-protein kinase iks1 [Pycnora praestabilis]|nr:MAG: putative serine/threonine-protein kinase iks1 [Pycnora praestabilis]